MAHYHSNPTYLEMEDLVHRAVLSQREGNLSTFMENLNQMQTIVERDYGLDKQSVEDSSVNYQSANQGSIPSTSLMVDIRLIRLDINAIYVQLMLMSIEDNSQRKLGKVIRVETYSQ
ncbi:unnamed protein product [Adineta ricciae]|uniref:Uncharacterized protein n=1 Tax=Adineta ricciae TaxID=249248 RepID=A0A815WRK5_ADIRI|nr:unnamed protein product [Adineta ricciae]CAF1549416.1 unnamed protein product [Adineta ricciae]